uniref:Ribonuclease H-like domain-containing protein n=1 Tax=Tanacetum cinerariifolium TaxID=118510 RepID=A0A6L2NN98_TANCI|nr:ribonuclease H-like domain-containing protein [Tanacetum cinerariifolium]
MAITAKDMQKRKNDVKARTTLLLALPDEHQLRFSKYDSVKELWEAILKTLGGNEATKKTKKNQLKQEYGDFKAKGSETLDQTFNRDDLDTMSLDDVYNHLKVYEPDVQKRAGSNLQNLAFISSLNNNNGKSEVPTVQGASTASAQVSTVSTNVADAGLSYDTVCAFIATQPNGSQIKYKDISHIDDDDIEKMDIKWNLALLSMRADREYRSPKSQDRGKRESYKKDPKVEEPTPKAMIAINGIGWDWSYMAEEDEASKNHAFVVDEEEVRKEKESIDFKIENFENALKDLDRLLGSQKLDKDMKGVGFNEYCDVPPPPTQVYSPPKKDLSWMGLPEFADDTITDYTRPTPSIDVSKSIREDLLDRDKSADKGSDSTDEMSHVLGTLVVANILASGGLRLVFTTASTGVSPTVVTASGSFSTAAIFTTASVAKPTTRVTRSSRGVLARDLEAKFAHEDQIIREQAKRHSEIVRIHAEKELEMMIAELDRSNEMVAKYLSEYEQAEAGLSHNEKVELINELLMYQRHLAQIKKYQAQQNKPATKTEKRNFYVSILRSNAGWKAIYFKGMTFDTIEVTDEKAKELWVEQKRPYEPNSRDPLWALQRGHHIFMLVEKDYPLTKGLTTLMLFNKLQVDQYLEMYLKHEHYALWEVIEFGDSYKALPEETAKDKGLAARTTLLLALPDEHQLRFSKYGSAKELWEAILKPFGGNEATKKTKKNQLKHQYGNFKAKGPETLEQTFNRLQAIKKTGKKITIQGSDVAGFDKSKVEFFNCHKMGHFSKECRSPRSQDRGERESYKKDPKVEKHAPKAMIAIDADEEEVPTEYALMAKSSSSSNNANLVTVRLTCITTTEKDLYWMGLPEFVDDTATDYTRPTPSIDVSKSISKEQEERWKSNNPSFFEQGGSSGNVVSKPMIKFVKECGCPNATKVNYTENTRKPTMKYAEIYRNTSQKFNCNHDTWVDKRKPGQGYWDSGCSRHITGNISYLSEYEPFNRGYVSFGHERGKITGKGSIKTGKLEFENVYFVEELKYNLFSVSQICDNKNSVLFTNTKCLVLGKDFKLVDDKHVLLRTPRQQNMYIIDLKNVVPYKNLTCLIAKASVDESMLWHRRFTWTFFLKSKDETSRILRNFITEMENLKDLNVKIIRSDNGGEFRNKEMDEFCSRKDNKREFSNARTPQRNGVTEKRNKTFIEAARTIPLGKFDAKGDEGYFVGYSLSSKAFRVFNKRTKKIKENLHVDFLENKSIEKGTGPDWLFNIDTLSNSMNYIPVVAETSSTNISGTKEDVHQAVKEKESPLRFIALPNWFHKAQMASLNVATSKDDAIPVNNAPQQEQQEVNEDKEVPKSSRNSNPTISTKVSINDSFELASSSTVETEVPTVSTHVSFDSLSAPSVTLSIPIIISMGGSSFLKPLSLGNAMSFENRLEDFFGDSSNAVSLNEVEADLSNIETPIQVSPTPTLRIHKDHPKSQIISLVDTPVQTRQKTKNVDEQSFIAIIHQKTNPDLLQYCLFSCFLSQEEPKKIVDALKDPSWVEAMQQELLQFKI